MGKSATSLRRSVSSAPKGGKSGMKDSLSFSDPKVQGVLLIGLLVVLSIALWFGFTHGCLSRRRRRNYC
ncbi:hypothetical protein RR46_10589 [Papilio xuthus]|uniref:Uncharacterized protein n=1 Tax=Papilio xuthus TaxID=66420 RepID=A0A194PKS1_PAPXU|nr:hypothetical protein RR46_10589 [Papilio xuthus]